MTSAHTVKFETPKKAFLNGLRFGPKKPKKLIVWMHGLGSSAFSMQSLVEKLMDKNTAVLTFNNRGHDVISRLSTKKKGGPRYAGAAHEVFTECVDDIEGAIRLAKKQGAKEIYLAGHSTGCQKSIYWAAKKGRGVKGIILLAPVSDWASGLAKYGKGKVARAATAARTLVARGKKHELLPTHVWPELLDAQRFLSLYTPDSVEEIFSYAQPKKRPTLLKKVRQPLLVFWAGNDEYCKHQPKEVAAWFESHVPPKSQVHIVRGANHGFKGKEKQTSAIIKNWIRD